MLHTAFQGWSQGYTKQPSQSGYLGACDGWRNPLDAPGLTLRNKWSFCCILGLSPSEMSSQRSLLALAWELPVWAVCEPNRKSWLGPTAYRQSRGVPVLRYSQAAFATSLCRTFTDRVSKGNGQLPAKRKKKSPQPAKQQEVIQWGSKMTCATGTSSLGESSEGESSAVTAKQQLFKAKRKAGVSSTTSLQLTEGLSDKYRAQLCETSAELQDCFQACKQPARTETKPNLCLLLLCEHKGASKEVYSPLCAMAAVLLGIEKPLGVHLLG